MRIQLRLALLAPVAACLMSAELSAQERFTLNGRDLTIYNLVGDVQIVRSSGNLTEIEVQRIGRDASRLQLVPSADGSTFSVAYPAGSIVYQGPGNRFQGQVVMTVLDDGTFARALRGGSRIDIFSRDRAPVDAIEAGANIVVHVPAGVVVRTRVAVGEIRASDVTAGLDLINTSSGAIAVQRVRGDVTLSSSSGSLSASDVEGNVTLRALSGSVDLQNARGAAISVKVVSGNIKADQLRAETVELEATSGSIDLGVPEIVDATIELQAISGQVNVISPLMITRQRPGYAAVRIGDGRAHVTAKTTSGNVTASSR